MADIPQQYENELQRRIAALTKRIKKIYEDGIQTITVGLSSVKYKNKPFSLSDYPQLKTKIEKVAKKMQASVYSVVVNGVKDSWGLANRKNNVLVDKRLAGKRIKKNVRQAMYDPNDQARNSFLKRKDKGMDLSKRVWKTMDPFKKELEQSLGFSISKGQSAADSAKLIKQYLNEPDKLFRRVRSEEGKLVLSQAARNYHPGQGVYRSSYKNALRVTRTENNLAYRTADHERWQQLPFVLGIEVKLSNMHPRYDICDNLVGKYPKDFKFPGWHPQCICYAIPIMASDKEFEKMEDALLAGEEIDPNVSGQIKAPPAGFSEWLTDNKERIQGWKNEPYWMRDNKQYLNGSQAPKKAPPPTPAPDVSQGGQKISSQFTNIQKSVAKSVKESLNSIDEIHGDGPLDDIPFKKLRSKQKNGHFSVGHDAKALEIGVTSVAKAPALTITHEMGHYLDLYSIGKKGSFGSTQQNSPMSKVLNAANETDAIKNIRSILEVGGFTIDGKEIALSWDTERHLQYLVDPKEIWARAYAQFIANKSTSKVLKNGLSEIITSESSLPYRRQWLKSDFKKLEMAIEEMLKDLGWINQ